MSNIFIVLHHCPWLVAYMFVLNLLIMVTINMGFPFPYTPMVCSESTSSIVSSSLINNVRVSNIDSISNSDVVVGLDIMEIVDSKLNTSYMSPILRKNWIVFDLLSSPLCPIAFSGDSVSFSNL